MEAGPGHRTDGEVLAAIDTALDALFDDRVRPPSDAEQLSLLTRSLRIAARLAAWQQRLAARIEAGEVVWREHRTSTTTWLAEAARLTPREARRLVTAGQGLARFEAVGVAAAAGTVLPGQAEAITGVLDALSDDLPAEAVELAQELMVSFADDHNAVELRRLTGRLVEVLDPEGAEAREAVRLEREHRRAMRNRHLRFIGDHQGSVLIRGSLPVAEAEGFIQIIDAYAAAAKRGLDRLDPLAEHLTPGSARADALLAMVHHHSQDALAPIHGGDRPGSCSRCRTTSWSPPPPAMPGCAAGWSVPANRSTRAPCAGGCATPTCCRSCSAAPPRSWTWVAPNAASPPGSAPRSKPGTAVASSPAATNLHGIATLTTSNPGGPAATPPCRTSFCSVRITTGSSSRVADPTPTVGRSGSPTMFPKSSRRAAWTPTGLGRGGAAGQM